MAKKKDTGLVPVSKYAIMQAGDAAAVLKENLGGSQLTQADLTRVKMPSGGSLNFEVASIAGAKPVDRIEGICIGFQDVRVYWEKSPEEGGLGTPPDCVSEDTFSGRGIPGGSCTECRFAEFGSHPRGAGQACAVRRLLFIVRPTDILPIVINLPPTSIAACKKFFMQLATEEMLSFWKVVMRIELEKASNAKGVAYAKATFTMASKVEPATIKNLHQSMEQFKVMFKRVAKEESISQDSRV